MSTATALRDRAVGAMASGLTAEAAKLFTEAAARPDANASILNSAANFFARQGQRAEAIELLRRAVDLDEQAHEAALNLALLLTGDDRSDDALQLLVEREEALRAEPRYWSIRANAERLTGDKRASLASYRLAAKREPANVKALHGQARMALETGEGAAELYRSLVAAAPNDAQAWLGFAQSLDAEGRPDEAREIAERLTGQAPDWVEGLEFLAQLRWQAGEVSRFTDHYPASDDPAVALSQCRMLAGVDQFAAAADVAAARRSRGDQPDLALVEAIHRGEAGDNDRAEAIFAGLELVTIDRKVHEARHRLRTGEADRAAKLLSEVVAQHPDHVSGWALLGIAWRLLGDEKADWLCRADGLVGLFSLGLDDDAMDRAIAYLDRLHDGSSMPVGQSVRGGTQTRGGLFDRHEPEAALIEDGFRTAVEDYRRALPPRDEHHPLLRHRDQPWRFAGSWSIRLFGSGRHTEHIHPQGLVSSAAYFVVPGGVDDNEQAGWLELGRPPPDLRVELDPLVSIRPEPGKCALFPSFLYHGTRPFSAGKRMSVAIDINLDRRR